MKYDFKKLNEEGRKRREVRDAFCDEHGLEIPGGVCATYADGTPANTVSCMAGDLSERSPA